MHPLTDCAGCAKVHVNELEDMREAGSEDLHGTDVRNQATRLADVLEELQFYRRKGNRKEEETRQSQGGGNTATTARESSREESLFERIDQRLVLRSQNAPAVACLEAEVKHMKLGMHAGGTQIDHIAMS